MSAISSVLLQTIKELQMLPSLVSFALAGGTNLALRFNHRESQDIDLFCAEIIGIKHFESIESEVTDFFGEENIIGLEYPVDKESEQYTYLRFWIKITSDVIIKVEVIQNMKMIHPIEVINGVRLVTTEDIGLFKLISGSSRAAKKDIYDLDFITGIFPLIKLFAKLEVKKSIFNKDEHKNIFDLDNEECPTNKPYLLLKFDKKDKQNRIKPIHSNDTILIVDNGKSWIASKISWRMKVRKLYKHLGIEYPKSN